MGKEGGGVGSAGVCVIAMAFRRWLAIWGACFLVYGWWMDR